VWEFWDGETRFVTYDTKEFAEYLSEYEGIVYAHNGGKFDWHFLLEYLSPYDDILIINGRIAKAKLGLCELRDSYNIIPVPLAAYKKDEFDYAILEEDQREKGDNPKKILHYLHSDCTNLYELVTRFIDQYGLQMTLAGAAMKQWVALSNQEAPKTDEDFYADFSPYYYGGRVECFESGVLSGCFRKFDINSSYPYAMLQEHPYSDTYTRHDGYVAGADFYDVECISLGALPFRSHGILEFPCDDQTRVYHVSKWELDAALDTGTIFNVNFLGSVTFVFHRNFADYVTHFMEQRWQCKEKGDDAGSLIAKLFGNSLYGKFAANPENYKNCMIVPLDLAGGLAATEWTFGGELGPWALAECPLEEDRRRYYNVATGASITGYARAKLWRGICSALRPIYCDTDAITCEQPGADIDIGDNLGQWKHEGDFDKLGIGGKKLYVMRGAKGWWTDENGKTIYSKKKPAKGIRLYAIASKGARLSERDLWRVARGQTVTYTAGSPTFSVKKPQSFVVRKIRKTAINVSQRINT
jgi:DNA polymerase type B, organellar and viral